MGIQSMRCARFDQRYGHSRWELATIQRDADALLRWVAFVSLRLYSLFLLTVWLVDGVASARWILAICRKCILRFEAIMSEKETTRTFPKTTLRRVQPSLQALYHRSVCRGRQRKQFNVARTQYRRAGATTTIVLNKRCNKEFIPE